MIEPDDLPMLVIYDRPADLPRGFVLVRWVVRRGVPEPIRSELLAKDLPSLDAARAMIPPGMVCITRDDRGDPKIVEVWL